MKNMVIASTKKTPEIIFKTSGDLMISGNSLPTNSDSFYQPIMAWIEELVATSPKNISIVFDLEHVNTSSTRIILQILRTLNGFKKGKGKGNLTIVWNYDKEDKDMLEQGETLQQILDRPFDFIEKES
jgi:hypothetical protein